MWISKPIYESLPYFYLLVGVIALSASMCLVGGLVVLLKRRDSRVTQRRGG
jgi:hypothetical protein